MEAIRPNDGAEVLPQPIICVTGATGYVGGRLVPRLLAEKYRVRVLVRDPGRLQGRSWLRDVEVVRGDVLDARCLAQALAGVEAAYYLVHSMRGGPDYRERDVRAARLFGQAARQAGLRRIIYLGGLGDPATDLSNHLRSRHETGQALREAGVPVTEFQAGVIIGAGSVSFEIIRYLTERVPLMICPRWVHTAAQPIAIGDVVNYLAMALRVPASAGCTIEIGGADRLTYRQMMLGYARVRGLHRLLVPMPILTPVLSSYWVHWVTPIPTAMARPLIEGLRNEVIVRSDSAVRLFPQVRPVCYERALRQALAQLEAGEVETAWSDALAGTQGDRLPVKLTTQEGLLIERRQFLVAAAPQAVFSRFAGIGGDRGWPYANWLWQLRGVLDRLIGGVGFRRGRRHPDELRVGDALDFWRVEAVEPGRLVRLRAEMRLPGRAWLQFEARPQGDGRTLLVQKAFFASKGLGGLAYWFLLYPVHGLIFSGMIRALAQQAVVARPSGSAKGARLQRDRPAVALKGDHHHALEDLRFGSAQGKPIFAAATRSPAAEGPVHPVHAPSGLQRL